MSPLPHNRRLTGLQSLIIDHGLGLAQLHGWSYALAYLIHKQTSPLLIQRLLTAGPRVRSMPARGRASLAAAWPEDRAMGELFQSLHLRRRT
ncbi:hypothetical protein [Duganella qianjiadongensis]|uniref:Uncharacterized protein n=1 Tax=Duganella qianjiadongensis TaxID=2692176 RepID=A0ABW9VHA0_9BURK|nr:hypothetical protein [Duganella qianjiadongensis]MYM38401.1 hypothetical protein [Duganella qianjiadongensis]